MNTSQWIVTIIEGLAVLAVIVAVLYEPVIARWEQRQKWKVLKVFNERKENRK